MKRPDVRVWIRHGSRSPQMPGPLSPRLCCKTRKSNGLENLAKDDFSTSLPLQSPAGRIRSSMVVFLVSDVVPHVSTREPHQRVWRISFVTPKRLLQHYLPETDIVIVR
jgi:hypothetical protein